MKAHPEAGRLLDVLSRCQSLIQTWTGVVYRSVSVPYANRDDLLNGQGAKHAGARWNPPNSVATIYTSLEIETSIAESLAHHRYYGIPIEQALPRVLVSVQAALARVLNLTESRILRRFGLTRSQLLTEDWRARNARGQETLTQTIGRLAWQTDWICEGLLVPSAADSGGVNLIIFPANLKPPGSYLLIVNRDQLPPRLKG